MRRGRFVMPAGVFPEPERPVPSYPEYAGLRELAQESVRRDGGFVDPVKARMRENIGRGPDWRIAVLGHDRRCTVLEMHMLLLAHGQDITPPAPQWLLDARAEAAQRQAERDAARGKAAAADWAAWNAAREGCPVELEVRRTSHMRPHRGFAHQLGHAIPKVDARSGRTRRHRAGRALCETESRSRPLVLNGGEGGPATCKSCLDYTPKIRLAAV